MGFVDHSVKLQCLPPFWKHMGIGIGYYVGSNFFVGHVLVMHREMNCHYEEK
jgi:hypothetical protein